MKLEIIASIKRRIELSNPKLFEKDTGLNLYIYY